LPEGFIHISRPSTSPTANYHLPSGGNAVPPTALLFVGSAAGRFPSFRFYPIAPLAIEPVGSWPGLAGRPSSHTHHLSIFSPALRNLDLALLARALRGRTFTRAERRPPTARTPPPLESRRSRALDPPHNYSARLARTAARGDSKWVSATRIVVIQPCRRCFERKASKARATYLAIPTFLPTVYRLYIGKLTSSAEGFGSWTPHGNLKFAGSRLNHEIVSPRLTPWQEAGSSRGCRVSHLGQGWLDCANSRKQNLEPIRIFPKGPSDWLAGPIFQSGQAS
jgi:hypothetical protein